MRAFRLRPRTLWWSATVLLAIGLIALVVVLVRTASQWVEASRDRQTPVAERTIPGTDVNPYGANFFLNREVEPWKVDKTLQMAADAGIGWVKLQFPWEQIEPERKGEYLSPQTRDSTWTKYDRIVEACEAYGLRIVARLDRPPAWTRQDNSYAQAPPDDYEDYGDFVYTFVSRYRGRIGYVQVWNEPNIFPEWGNRPVDPGAYVELLEVAYRRAREADPNVLVLSAPLAITLGEAHPEPGRWRSMNDLDYLEAMYEAGASAYFDIYSVNAFGLQYAPEDPPDPAVLNFQRVVLHREIMERHGDSDKPVWFNEYGWNAAPDTMPPDRLTWQRVSEQEQADYTLRGIRLAREEWPWAGVFMIWYFRQVGNMAPDSAEYYFRMVDPDFTPRQVYQAVQDATRALDEVTAGVYQETNPAVRAYGEWEHALDAQARGGAALVSTAPGASVTLSFRGQNVELATQRGPDGGRLLVSLDGQPAGGLPRDADGNAYVSLYGPTTESGVTLPLVADTAPGAHTLRLTVAETPDPGSSGNRVAVDAFDVDAGHTTSAPMALFAGAFAALVVGVLLLRATLRRLRRHQPGR